jgi:hypothetical protein
MVNEFCMIGNAYCEGILRQSCYLVHCTGGNENKYFDNFPMGNCMKTRDRMGSSWLKARFVLPQDMKRYQNIGINHFKITGRTHPTKYCLFLAEQYMNQRFDGNLLELWIHLQNIGKKEVQYSDQMPFDIPCKHLDLFMDKWFKNPTFKCDENCGTTCNYCDQLFDKIAIK